MPTPIIPSADYYDDESLHGNYQFITLEDIINNYIMSRGQDDYTALVPRYKILYQARRGMRELYYDVVRDIRAIELELSNTLNVTLPPDFINYVRISWVDDLGQLHPMSIDNRFSIAQEYLQDSEYQILFDGEGCPLQASKGFNEPMSEIEVLDEIADYRLNGSYTYYSICDRFHPNRDGSRIFTNGKYNIDKNAGLIQFSSDVFGQRVVLEYISDGLYTGCEGRPESEIRVHKFAESPLLDWIYWKLVEKNRNVPMNEKMRARKEYYNSRRVAKRRINTLRIPEILKAFQGDSKWIKA